VTGSTQPTPSDTRVLVLTPTGRDSATTCAVLQEAGFQAEPCPDMPALCASIADGAGAALLAEEALTPHALGALSTVIKAQPAWSDFPIVLLSSSGRDTHESGRILAEIDAFTNAAILERPLRKATLVSALRVALRSRRRQYEMRSYLRDLALLEQEREDLLGQQRHIAETLQRTLLKAPAPDAFLNLEVETQYAPAWTEAMIGGDFFDVFAIGDKVALVVGDVVGKGMRAASMMAEVKFALRAIVMQNPNPAQALAQLNRYVLAAAPDDVNDDPRLVAVLLAVVNAGSGQTEIAVAGAEPPVLIRCGAKAEAILANGVPIGVMEKAAYDTASVTLGAGDILLLATDGITEARQGGEFYGPEGLMAAADAAALLGASLASCGEAIVADARAYSGGAFRDDVCLLLARWGV
jgi:serine phosphatase RsbU (regulator of sigma subunit)